MSFKPAYQGNEGGEVGRLRPIQDSRTWHFPSEALFAGPSEKAVLAMQHFHAIEANEPVQGTSKLPRAHNTASFDPAQLLLIDENIFPFREKYEQDASQARRSSQVHVSRDGHTWTFQSLICTACLTLRPLTSDFLIFASHGCTWWHA